MSLSDALPEAPKPPIAHPVRVFLFANFIYLWLVHAWGLWVPPLAVDHAIMDALKTVPALSRGCLSLMLDTFGTSYASYRVANITLLYGCMIGVFFLTKAIVKGPWWLGSLGAVLLMANPLKTDATLAITGSTELLPAFLVICGILLAVWPFGPSKGAAEFGGAFLLALAMRDSPDYILAPFAVVCLQGSSVGFRPISTIFWLLMGTAVVFLHVGAMRLAPTDALLSLFMIVYPIGLLPSTAAALTASPWLATAAAALVVGTWIALWRVTRHPAVFWCGLAAILLRISMPPIDLVTMQGGETMLLPIALIAIGFAAVCHSILKHPAWPRHVVFLTTVLCLIFFGLQIRAIRAHSAPSAPAPAMAELHP